MHVGERLSSEEMSPTVISPLSGDGASSEPARFASSSGRARLPYDPGRFWDEMVNANGQPRAHYEALVHRLASLDSEQVARRQKAADRSFEARGVTFATKQDPNGLEKILPFDLVPRLITADEWTLIETGLEQRVRALNLFIEDVYHDQHIIASDIIPTDLILGSQGYRRELYGLDVPLGVYTHIVGSDLVRDETGRFYVLEDNLRTPSGVSYVIENRRALKRVWPQIFGDYNVRPVEGYPQELLGVLRAVAPRGIGNPTVAMLTPGVYNSAFFEHVFLARSMGIDLVQSSDLFVDDGFVYMRTTRGPRRLDVIYRRVDDDFLDPLSFRPNSLLGVPGLLAACHLGRVTVVNAMGAGVADDKAIYAYVPDIIRFYLGEDPILPNVPTYLPTTAEGMAYIMSHLEELVVKAVSESGGVGMLIGPHATRSELDEFRTRIQRNPRRYIAQPTLALSRHPCWVGDHFEGRHVDLRPFVLFGSDIHVTPGGLTRVAIRKGSLVVNSSQGGGSKDTWVLADEPPLFAELGSGELSSRELSPAQIAIDLQREAPKPAETQEC